MGAGISKGSAAGIYQGNIIIYYRAKASGIQQKLGDAAHRPVTRGIPGTGSAPNPGVSYLRTGMLKAKEQNKGNYER
jgi:hypothetical protein